MTCFILNVTFLKHTSSILFIVKVLSLPVFLSTPAATAAKLGAKLDAVGSGLWHMSLRYKLFMLNREKQKLQVNKVYFPLSQYDNNLEIFSGPTNTNNWHLLFDAQVLSKILNDTILWQ